MRTLWLLGTLAVMTLLLGSLVILAEIFGVPRRPGGIYDWAPRAWARAIIRAAGVRLQVHGTEHFDAAGQHVVVANHVSWFDIPVMIMSVPRFAAVAKQELQRIPIFGRAAGKVGVVYLDRENRKAAFEAYETAAEEVRNGASVVVFPEGTRGHEYALRPFKKGPFVLAVASQSTIVPVVIHGTLPLGRGKDWRGDPSEVPGVIDVHVLPPISAAGTTYGDRNQLADTVHAQMNDFLHRQYGIEPRVAAARPDTTSSPDAGPATPALLDSP
jgi:1-acyl-sn-glycerol-3-phosphate acyltransferase